jgi:hypothetical protein
VVRLEQLAEQPFSDNEEAAVWRAWIRAQGHYDPFWRFEASESAFDAAVIVCLHFQ